MNNNFSLLKIVNESSPIEMSEQVTQAMRDLAKKLFKKTLTDDQIYKKLAKTVTSLEASVKTASTNWLKKNGDDALQALRGDLPRSVKDASKNLVFKRIIEAGKTNIDDVTKKLVPLTDDQIATIINETKAETNKIWAEALGKRGDDVVQSTIKTSKGGLRAAWNSAFGRFFKGGKPKPQVNIPPTTGGILFSILKGGWRATKWLALLGVISLGYAGYVLYKNIYGDALPDLDDFDWDNVPEDDVKKAQDWKRCILDALEGNNISYGIDESSGLAYVEKVTNTFGGRSTGGWIRFYMGYYVKTKNGSTGKWDCSTDLSSLINEQGSSNELTTKQVSQIIKSIDDNLSGDVFQGDSGDMKDALDIIKGAQGKTYQGKDVIKVIVSNYKRIVGKDLKDHVMNLKNLDFEGIEAQKEFLKIINVTKKSGEDKDGTKSDSTSHLTVTWDKDNGDKGKTGGGEKIKYSPCDGFPMSLGCISDKIKDIQRCLNPTATLKVDGYFGPETLKAMKNKHLFAKDKTSNDFKITEEIYKKVTEELCSEKDTKTGGKTSKETIKKQDTGAENDLKKVDLKPIDLVVYDAEAMLQKNTAKSLENLKNKTIDGSRIIDIIQEKLKFTAGGRYVLKLDEQLTEKQLKVINQWMAGRGYSIDPKFKITNKQSKYVWKAEDPKYKRIARKQQAIDRIKDSIEDEK